MNFTDNFTVAQGWGMVKRNRMRMCLERMDEGPKGLTTEFAKGRGIHGGLVG